MQEPLRPSGFHRGRDGFSIDVAPPFRLDLSVWALRRRPTNTMDRWDGTSYRRALVPSESAVGICVTRAGGADVQCLHVALPSRPLRRRVEQDSRASLESLV